ncbi:MAG: ABC transporter substrate-binding protein [Chloroflexi bacterium]|nr:ABC transporter substrate-binding protein [Chloroflexota bacterium]
MHTTISRRSALKLLASSSGAALVLACTAGPLAPPTSAPSVAATPVSAPGTSVQPGATSTTAAPVRGGTLRIGLAAEPANIDGHVRTPGSDLSYWLAFDRLIDYDQKAQPQPALAESWDIAPDYKTVTFHLRQGVTYHSGREFTSDDVKWNLLRVREPALAGSTLGAFSQWWTDIATPDKYTITLTSEQSRPTLFDSLQLFNMLDQASMEGPNAKSSAVGTGPFVLQEWVQGDHLTFTANKNYWNTGQPYLDGFIARVFRGEQPAMNELESGTIDTMRMTSVQDVVRLQKDASYSVLTHPNPGTFWEIGFNVTLPPFDNKLVRQAFNFAFDRQYLAQTIYQGTATASALPWSSSSPAYEPNKVNAYPFDLDKARSLLSEANVSGQALEVVLSPGQPLVESMMQVYQAALATLNMQLNVNVMEAATWLSQVNGVKYNGLYLSGDNNAHVNPGTLWSTSPGWRPVPGNNSGWKNDQWTQLVTSLITETDPTRRSTLTSQMNDFVLDQSWIFPIASSPSILVSTHKLQGLVPALYNGWFFDTAWLAQN